MTQFKYFGNNRKCNNYYFYTDVTYHRFYCRGKLSLFNGHDTGFKVTDSSNCMMYLLLTTFGYIYTYISLINYMPSINHTVNYE